MRFSPLAIFVSESLDRCNMTKTWITLGLIFILLTQCYTRMTLQQTIAHYCMTLTNCRWHNEGSTDYLTLYFIAFMMQVF
jgi:hypothetical protein